MARIEELEALCHDILAAVPDVSLPPALMLRLRRAVGELESAADHRFTQDLPELHEVDGAPTVVAVAEDPLLLQVIGRILARDNAKLILAGSGAEAVTALDAHGGVVDLLLTDSVMEGMDGPELARQIRERWPDVRVLYQVDRRQRQPHGTAPLRPGEAVLEKPFTSRGLREAVRRLLHGAINSPDRQG
jgi:CheY-like chemotaxis protein